MELRRRITLGAVAVLAVTLVGCGTPQDPAGDGPAPVPTTEVVQGEGEYEPSPEELEDLAAAAGEESPDTLRVLRSQQPFGDLAGRLEAQHPDTFVEAGLDPIDGADAWISFTTRPPADVFARVAEGPLDVEVRWGLPFSAREIVEALDAAPTVVGEQVDPDGTLGGYPADAMDAVEVEYTFGSAPDPAEVERRSTALESAVDDLDLVVPVRLTYVPDLESGLEND